MRRPSTKTTPLSHERLAILLALAVSEKYGSVASISGQIIADSVGRVYIKKSTLYKLVSELEAGGYLTPAPSLALTKRGIRTLGNELARTERQLLLLKQRTGSARNGNV